MGEELLGGNSLFSIMIGLGKWQVEKNPPPHPHSLSPWQTHAFWLKFLVFTAYQGQLSETPRACKGPWVTPVTTPQLDKNCL